MDNGTGKPDLEKSARAGKLLLPAVAAAAGLAVLLSLGSWQLDRLAWKTDLIAQVEAGLSSPPQAAPGPDGWDSLGPEDDYRHVRLSGAFLQGTVFYYTALSKPAGPLGGPGVLVYAPFRTDKGWTLLVNRGFLPQGQPGPLEADARAAALVPPAGPQELTGLLRLSETPNWTTPAPDAGDRLWFARDTSAMGRFLGLEATELAPYSVDLDAGFTPKAGLPQAGETIVRFKNDHLGYALTWFGLAATLAGVFLAYTASVLWPRNMSEGMGQ